MKKVVLLLAKITLLIVAGFGIVYLLARQGGVNEPMELAIITWPYAAFILISYYGVISLYKWIAGKFGYRFVLRGTIIQTWELEERESGSDKTAHSTSQETPPTDDEDTDESEDVKVVITEDGFETRPADDRN